MAVAINHQPYEPDVKSEIIKVTLGLNNTLLGPLPRFPAYLYRLPKAGFSSPESMQLTIGVCGHAWVGLSPLPPWFHVSVEPPVCRHSSLSWQCLPLCV